MTPPSAAPAFCACSISASCSRRPRRSAVCHAIARQSPRDPHQWRRRRRARRRPPDRSRRRRRRRLSAATIARLDAMLPPTWSQANPVDIIGDADPRPLCRGLEALLADPENDAVLVLNVETALASATEAARAVADLASAESGRRVMPKPVLAAWIGDRRTGRGDLHRCPHPSLRHRDRGGARLHASRPLPARRWPH